MTTKDNLKKIYKHLEEHVRVVKEYLGNNQDGLLGVFLYGSQNYNLMTDNSDIDTKAIYIPSYEELVFDKPKSVEIEVNTFFNNEHCELKDIREMVKMWKKQNINFMEILFTDYYWINEQYEENFVREFVIYNEKIARYNPEFAIKSMAGQALATLERGKIENKNLGKILCNAERLHEFFHNYVQGKRYKDCLIPHDTEKYLKLKLGIVPPDEKRINYLIQFFRFLLTGKSNNVKKEEFDFKPGILKLLKDREL
jgi:predicted nucleotidyltransferase